MKEKMNWLFVKYGSMVSDLSDLPPVEEIRWVKDKSYDEIVEIGRKEFEENKKGLLKKKEEDYVEEFCEWHEKEGFGVEYGLNEEESAGFYREEELKELIQINNLLSCYIQS